MKREYGGVEVKGSVPGVHGFLEKTETGNGVGPDTKRKGE